MVSIKPGLVILNQECHSELYTILNQECHPERKRRIRPPSGRARASCGAPHRSGSVPRPCFARAGSFPFVPQGYGSRCSG